MSQLLNQIYSHYPPTSLPTTKLNANMALRAILVTLLFASLFLSPTVFGYPTQDIKTWCSQTPNPRPCEHFLSQNPNHSPINQKSDFLKITKQLALERAMKAQSNIFSLGSKCRNNLEKAAWQICLELYEHTILQLNKTVDPGTKCTQTDAQTWLSAALTNLETCRDGFIELGVSDYDLLPLMSNNVSKLISNALAINKIPYSEPSYKDGFPTWVRGGDRKLLQSSSPASQANIVVAKDGSGNYKTINEAITAASKRSGSGRYVIYVKQGTYIENVEIKLKNIMLVGDGIGKTIITGSKSYGGGYPTFKTATVAVVGDGFIARDITFQNTAGAANHQAVALRSGSDQSVFYRCGFEGYQDTLNVHCQTQFYRECDIYGTVDFIFGNAAVVFQKCNIYARYPPNKTNAITAQGRTAPDQNTGISIHDCTVTAASDLKSSQSSVKT
ncbi:Pectinesterase 2 [Morella rubra]|uniref:Pectinesterase n=1 Tax=Morella rubra TaxID=262757 RepID=A0A6A1V9Z8_9ROSI|nr:Pectinesterase 2 [Morella rubra]